MRSFTRGTLASSAFLAAVMSASPVGAVTNVLFILDASASMWGWVDGRPKIEVARQALKTLHTELLAQLGEMNTGLMVYGHRSEGDCGDIELVTRVSAVSAATLAHRIDEVVPKGKTPLAESLTRAANVFPAGELNRNLVVLLTDGIESCNGDPCQAAASLRAASVNVSVNVVGFDLSDQDREAVQCIADEGGGRYYDAKNAPQLAQAMTQVREQVVQTAQASRPASFAEDINLLSPINGGELLVAPEEDWKKAISGKEDDKSGIVHFGQEAVFGFKDERPATFSKFAMLVRRQDGSNPKEYELLVADDLSGPFRSLGTFTTHNMLLLRTPYQEFTFPVTKARYLKLKIVSGWGGTYVNIPQIRLMGRLD